MSIIAGYQSCNLAAPDPAPTQQGIKIPKVQLLLACGRPVTIITNAIKLCRYLSSRDAEGIPAFVMCTHEVSSPFPLF